MKATQNPIEQRPVSSLQLIPTSGLEALVDKYALASLRFHLSDFERCAVLRGIQSELAERDTARRNVFQFPNDRERLQAVIESKEREILSLESLVNTLENLLESREADKSGA